MKRCVRVYIEGGAEGRIADRDFRRGWKKFLDELHKLARNNGYNSLEIVCGKSRQNVFHRFTKYNIEHPNDLCVLIVDAETAVPTGAQVWETVACRKGDNWERPTWATERHLYLIVQFVETWLLTDQDALQRFFKRGFNPRSLPTTNLEERPKKDIEQALKEATKGSSKGSYRHGQAHEILEFVRPKRVKTLPHGNRLFETLSRLIRNEPET